MYLWTIIKRNELCIIWVLEGECRGIGAEILFKEMITENFPNRFRDLNIQVYEAVGHVIISTQSDLLQDSLW